MGLSGCFQSTITPTKSRKDSEESLASILEVISHYILIFTYSDMIGFLVPAFNLDDPKAWMSAMDAL